MIVEQGVGTVGQCHLGQFVEALVRHLHRVVGSAAALLGERDLHRHPRPLETTIADERAQLFGGAVEVRRLGRLEHVLHPEHDLDLDGGLPLEHLVDVPLAICGLAP